MTSPAIPQDIITDSLAALAEKNPHPTDGKWLEGITVAAGPHLRDWDLAECHSWGQWPARTDHFPDSTPQDIGIDAVAVRRSDGHHIAIQCKARQLDAAGRGADIRKDELDKFVAASANPFWAERWLVTNGDNRISDNARRSADMAAPDRPLKLINIHADLIAQQSAAASDAGADTPADAANPPRQTRQSMQDEAVAESVRILRKHVASDSGGRPVGQARGKLVLPCGTGKTRISLRIVEELTAAGELSIVMCPSIALVAQIRREYLQHAAVNLRALAVCSDETAGYNLKKTEDTRNTSDDPTLDIGNVSASEIKGLVTTDPGEIARWIKDGQSAGAAGQVSVIFGTYQSGHRIAAALSESGAVVQVLIADEAHRTAGLRRNPKAEQRLRDFTLCHDQDAFPAIYRVYQTATPRIYDTRKMRREKADDWIVRTMDDEKVFGVELYRKSYLEAVNNGWLADYRIIALGINDQDSFDEANRLAANTKNKGRRALTTHNYLSGLTFALVMGGATQHPESGNVPIKSCIAFMNKVDKSKTMERDLQTDTVRQWLSDWMSRNRDGQAAARYTLEHLDATSNVMAREEAKRKLAAASAPDAAPYGIINVGIFGEGTDAPALNAVAFLEPRRSPIDVIQAVGRAMRVAPGKEMGYIICPIYIPPHRDPETHLKVSGQDEGWQELGQILLALRAHDQRIEDNLSELMQVYLPPPPLVEHSFVAVATDPQLGIQHREHSGPPGSAQQAVSRVLDGEITLDEAFPPVAATGEIVCETPADYAAAPEVPTASEPTQIITGKKNRDGSNELRMDTVARGKPNPDGTPGPVNREKTRVKAGAMINKGAGVLIPASPTDAPVQLPERRPRRTPEQIAEANVQQALRLLDWDEHGDAITVNLLTKSGLTGNRVVRDLNILETTIRDAARHLKEDELRPALDRHFGLDNLKDQERQGQADGATIAALLLMNAMMLHQRIANGRWLPQVRDLASVKNDTNVVRAVLRQWHGIIAHDFRPILEPAVQAIEAVEDTGKTGGLERALRHLAAEAERIAETYADMGADHAGPLFNRVMGNQASDGAFFTRPTAAAIAARLTLDVAGDAGGAAGAVDWTDAAVWQDHKILDPACGSGTLLAALLSEMKRRARQQGATPDRIGQLQKLAVEDTIRGLDINPISLQLAASQLTAGNQAIRYYRMGLHLMPYGPQPDNPAHIPAGSLELLGQQAIVPRPNALGLPDDRIASQTVWQTPHAELDLAVDAVKDTRIVIMNPPFTNRAKMGEKFEDTIKQPLRRRVDAMEQLLVRSDPELTRFVDKNAMEPLFTALADKCVDPQAGILTMINPTVALCAPSALNKRRILSQRFHIHTVLTCHQPGQINMSQNTSVNESILVLRRHAGPKPDTRFINLDRFPVDDNEVDDLHQCLADCDGAGVIANGWGEVSYWPAERIAAGDWTPAIWRAPELAQAAARFANDDSLQTLEAAGLSPAATGQQLRGSYERAAAGQLHGFPILKSKGAAGQTRIQSQPDEDWIPKNYDDKDRLANGGVHPLVEQMQAKAGHLLITAGQDTSTGRLIATADDTPYVGNGWMPVTGMSAEDAKALAVFINSTPGRLQLMRVPGRKLAFPTYSTDEAANLRIPDVQNDVRVRQILAECWEETRELPVPQYREGECAVRVRWDAAVAEALGWDAVELGRLRGLLHQEPHVRGLGYGQYGDALEGDGGGDDGDGDLTTPLG